MKVFKDMSFEDMLMLAIRLLMLAGILLFLVMLGIILLLNGRSC